MLFAAAAGHRGARGRRAVMYHGTGRRAALDDAVGSGAAAAAAVCRGPARSRRTAAMTQSTPVT